MKSLPLQGTRNAQLQFVGIYNKPRMFSFSTWKQNNESQASGSLVYIMRKLEMTRGLCDMVVGNMVYVQIIWKDFDGENARKLLFDSVIWLLMRTSLTLFEAVFGYIALNKSNLVKLKKAITYLILSIYKAWHLRTLDPLHQPHFPSYWVNVQQSGLN